MRDDLEKPNGANLAQLRDRPTTVYVILPAQARLPASGVGRGS
jgi:hypothetical protein